LEVVDFTADPCEDFQQFACGKWLADNPIPPEEVYLSRQSPTVAEVDKINIGMI
jgi:predicted metalloendopeptidase